MTQIRNLIQMSLLDGSLVFKRWEDWKRDTANQKKEGITEGAKRGLGAKGKVFHFIVLCRAGIQSNSGKPY